MRRVDVIRDYVNKILNAIRDDEFKALDTYIFMGFHKRVFCLLKIAN